jgi:hypothetical protein
MRKKLTEVENDGATPSREIKSEKQKVINRERRRIWELSERILSSAEA